MDSSGHSDRHLYASEEEAEAGGTLQVRVNLAYTMSSRPDKVTKSHKEKDNG